MDNVSEAVATVEERWNTWNKRFARRSKFQTQKTVLDVLSFESKAAFHQCYSAAWLVILPHLMSDQEPREIFENFHGLWHLDQRIESPKSGQSIRLLHGLVLGLHPAFSLLIACTKSEACQSQMGVVVGTNDNPSWLSLLPDDDRVPNW